MRNLAFAKPRITRTCSWFLLCLSAFAVSACDVGDNINGDKANHSPNNPNSQVQSQAANVSLDAAHLDKQRKNSHLSTAVVTQTTLSPKNQAKYAQASHLPYANPNAPKGGELSLAATGMFNSLNAFIDTGVPATGTFYLYDTLMAGSLDESYVMYPQLAAAVSFDPNDSSWIIYHIHPQARFWDGSAVQARDIKATFEAILSQGLMSWRAFLSGIEAIEVLDTQRVKFYFDKNASADLGATVGLMPIFAKSDIEARFGQASLTPLMGSGPYQIGQVVPSRHVEYVRDEHYWAKDLMVNKGRFNFNRINFHYYQDDAVAFEAFKLGQYRFHQENDMKRWATFSPQNHQSPIIKQGIRHQNPVLMQGLVMNMRRPIFQQKIVRQAMNLAFDFSWVNQRLLYGSYERLNSYFFGSKIQAIGKPSDAELKVLQQLTLNDDEKSALIGVPEQPTSRGDGYNRENLLKARELLLQAGWHYEKGQLFDANNQPVRIEILVKEDKHQAMLLPYIQNLQRLGIVAAIRRLDAASYLARKRQFDFDMIIDEFMQGNSPGAEQAYLWGSKSAQEIGNQNTIGVQSQAVDSLIEKLSQAKSQAQIEVYAKVLDRLLLAGEYMIPWYGTAENRVMYWQGYQHPSRLPSSSLGLDYWWYDARLASSDNENTKRTQ